MLIEPQLNGRLASVIREMSVTAGWNVREEVHGALRGRATIPDILITRAAGPPVVIEVEYPPASTLTGDCMKSLGRELNPSVASSFGKVSSVISIRATEDLHQCDTGDQAQKMLEQGHKVEYAVYQGNAKQHIRFPNDGFIEGSVRDLVDFIRPAAESQETIDIATKEFERGVESAAAILLTASAEAGIVMGQHIGAELRQPWPEYPSKEPRKTSEIRRERANQVVREQTAKMAAAILINALAYQQNLAGYSAKVKVDGQLMTRTVKNLAQVRMGGGYHPSNIMDEWSNILSINYWPIFDVAKRILILVPPLVATGLIQGMVSTANAIQSAIRQNDVAGTVFQRLIADRQTLATYYTRPEATTLAAHLAVSEALDWSDPNTLKNYRIADYACGTGGLVLAAYQRARNLHRLEGGNPDNLHPYMMEESLTACDIMPAAVHLTSSLLSSVAPLKHYRKTRNVLYPFGGTGNLDNKGKPEVEIGSLELLNLTNATKQAAMPLSGQITMGPTGELSPTQVDMTPLSQSLVIMNPPFTAPTNHEGRNKHANTVNPAFAAFQTSNSEQVAMASKVRNLAKGTIGDGYAGLGTHFTAIAHNMVRPNGHVALILPLSSMLGGSWDGKNERSWQKLRRLLNEGYNEITIVTIAQAENRDAAFSADTDIAETMIVARRLGWGEAPEHRAYFVNLAARPRNKLEAQETARSILKAKSKLTDLGSYMDLRIGNTAIGTISLEKTSSREKWTVVRVSSIELLQRARGLAQGILRLPQSNETLAIPVTQIGDIGLTGPVHRSILGAFTKEAIADSGAEYPMLWNQDSKVQISMLVSPDSHGIKKQGKSEAADKLWSRASHLHINCDFRFNSNPTAAAFTERLTLGGRAWPNLRMQTVEEEKATCLWLNSTLGMLCYWLHSNRTTGGRGTTTVTAIPSMPVLDVRKLSQKQTQRATQIYDELCEADFLPANEAYRDDTRKELDRRLLTEVLMLPKDSSEKIGILRNQWCMEPTVSGTKATALSD